MLMQEHRKVLAELGIGVVLRRGLKDQALHILSHRMPCEAIAVPSASINLVFESCSMIMRIP